MKVGHNAERFSLLACITTTWLHTHTLLFTKPNTWQLLDKHHLTPRRPMNKPVLHLQTNKESSVLTNQPAADWLTDQSDRHKLSKTVKKPVVADTVPLCYTLILSDWRRNMLPSSVSVVTVYCIRCIYNILCHIWYNIKGLMPVKVLQNFPIFSV